MKTYELKSLYNMYQGIKYLQSVKKMKTRTSPACHRTHYFNIYVFLSRPAVPSNINKLSFTPRTCGLENHTSAMFSALSGEHVWKRIEKRKS